MASARQKEYKIRKAFVEQSMPLLEVWREACDLNEIETEMLRLKYFDESDPTESEIIEILQEKFNYYYSERSFRRHWRKVQRKISSIIP